MKVCEEILQRGANGGIFLDLHEGSYPCVVTQTAAVQIDLVRTVDPDIAPKPYGVRIGMSDVQTNDHCIDVRQRRSRSDVHLAPRLSQTPNERLVFVPPAVIDAYFCTRATDYVSKICARELVCTPRGCRFTPCSREHVRV